MTTTAAELRRPWLDTVFFLGLAGVYLVNAAVAVLHPEDFAGLVANSAVGAWVDGDVVGPVIALNDVVLGVAVLVAARVVRVRPYVLAWSGAWLLAVTVVKLTAF